MEYIISPCREQLRGEHNRKLSPAQNHCWWQFQNLAGAGSRAGFIEKFINIPYSDEDLAYETNCPLELVIETKLILKKLNWIDILDEPKGLIIINPIKWDNWQLIKVGEQKSSPRRKSKSQEEIENEEAKITFKYLDNHPYLRNLISKDNSKKDGK